MHTTDDPEAVTPQERFAEVAASRSHRPRPACAACRSLSMVNRWIH